MQIAITGRGGQGVLFLTRILSECALEMGLEVIASETHGMAMRGGSVISTLKVGPFRGPLDRKRPGGCDAGPGRRVLWKPSPISSPPTGSLS